MDAVAVCAKPVTWIVPIIRMKNIKLTAAGSFNLGDPKLEKIMTQNNH
jgi:hypothetical protein